MADSDDDDKGQPNMAGFLFGNLDENNNLDADYLDEVGASVCNFQAGLRQLRQKVSENGQFGQPRCHRLLFLLQCVDQGGCSSLTQSSCTGCEGSAASTWRGKTWPE